MGQVADCDFGMTAIGFIHIESWIVSITATRHESINPVVMAGTNFVARLDLVVRQGGLFEQDFGNRVSESVKVMNKDILAWAMKSNVRGDSLGYKGFSELRPDVKSFSISLGADMIMVHAKDVHLHVRRGHWVCHGWVQ